jgi:hypothetical protein
LIWEDEQRNLLHDEGEIALLSAYFATTMTGYGASPGTLYVGLDNRVAVDETDQLADLENEPSTNGYARVAVDCAGDGATGEWVITQPAQAYQAKTIALVFTASGGSWGPVSKGFLCTSADASGKLISTVPLSMSRTPGDGETITVYFIVRLSE